MPNKEENIFAKKDEISSLIKDNLLLSISNIDKPLQKGIDSSDLTKCGRYIYYKNKDGIPEKMRLLSKQLVVDKWLKTFSANKIFDFIASGYVCCDIHYNLTGVIDLIFKIVDNPRQPLAIMIKTENNTTFKEIISGKVPRRDIVEIMANMWMAEIADGILIYENNQDLTFEIFHVTPDKYLINAIKSKCKEISSIVGEIQKRPYDKISIECDRCYCKNRCWKQED